MSLATPTPTPIRRFVDIYGKTVYVGNSQPVLLAFFRDALCPFCHFRIFELTQHYERLKQMGLKVVAVFSATPEDVKTFYSKRKPPFPLVADPTFAIQKQFEVQKFDSMNKMMVMVKYFHQMLRGMLSIGFNGLKSNSNVLPADFLIDMDGTIVDTFYSKELGDRMPIDNIFAFAGQHALKNSIATPTS